MHEVIRDLDTLQRGCQRCRLQRVSRYAFDILPAPRGEDFRVSAPFIEYCRVLSEHLGRANRGER